MGLEAREQTREGTSGPLSAWCNFTWARVYRCVSMARRRCVCTCPRAEGSAVGKEGLDGRAFSLPFRIRRWKLQLSFSKYRRLELINIWDICIGDRFDSVWGERNEKNWFKNAYREVCPEIQMARYRWKLVPLKNIERNLLIRWLEDFRKFSDTCVSWNSSIHLFSFLNLGWFSRLSSSALASTSDRKRVGGGYSSLKFKQLVLANFYG